MENILTFSEQLNHPLRLHPLGGALYTGEDSGHTFIIHVTDSGGSAVPFTGVSASGYFIRCDGTTVIIPGEAAEGTITLTLTAGCYAVPGRFRLVIKANTDGKSLAVFAAEGTVLESRTDTVADPENIVPDLDTLLKMTDTIEALYTKIRGEYDSGALHGRGLTILGVYADEAELRAAQTDPEPGAVYAVGTSAPYEAWLWDGVNGCWVDLGQTVAASGLPSDGTAGQLLIKGEGNAAAWADGLRILRTGTLYGSATIPAGSGGTVSAQITGIPDGARVILTGVTLRNTGTYAAYLSGDPAAGAVTDGTASVSVGVTALSGATTSNNRYVQFFYCLAV